MPNTIISGDFVGLGTITSRTEDANFPDGNVEDLWHLKRRFRADDVNVGSWLLKFDFGSAQTVEGVFLNDVNFDEVVIQGNDADEWVWPPPSYNSGATVVDIALDETVNRYKAYIPVSGFDLRWMLIYIPASASAVGSYLAKWQIGTVVVLDSITEITKNTYSRTSVKAFRDIEMPSEGFERINLGEMRWEGSIGFDTRKESNETSLWALNNIDNSAPLVFYENDSDTSKAYLCLRDGAYEGSLIHHGVARGNSVEFKELT